MIHGIIFEKLEGQRTLRPGERISRLSGFQHNNRITNLSTIHDSRGIPNNTMLKIDFIFTTTYSPPIASITLHGHILYSSKQLSLEDIVSEWRQSNKLPNEVAKEVVGNIIARCIQKATVISDQLSIPPPISMPAQQSGKTQSKDKKPMDNTSFFV